MDTTFELFNNSTTPAVMGRIAKPALRITERSRFTFNAAAAEFLKIKPGDCVEFVRDKANPADFYVVAPAISGEGFKVFRDSVKCLAFCNKKLHFIIADAGDRSREQTFSLKIAKERTELAPGVYGYGLLGL